MPITKLPEPEDSPPKPEPEVITVTGVGIFRNPSAPKDKPNG